MLIECDPSIKSIIVNIDSENHDFIIEDLDEERVVVKENTVHLLKQKLEDVRISIPRDQAGSAVCFSSDDGGPTPLASVSRKTCHRWTNRARMLKLQKSMLV